MPLIITPSIVIPDDELEWKFIRASGPGGQNVNKVSSAVQLRFLLPINSSIPVAARNRLRAQGGQKILDDGTILISARSERSQEQNRRDALERLSALIQSALVEPKIRKKNAAQQGLEGTPDRIQETPRHHQAGARTPGLGLGDFHCPSVTCRMLCRICSDKTHCASATTPSNASPNSRVSSSPI